MPTDILTPDARRENAAALAVALGIDLSKAATALKINVVVSANSTDAIACLIREEVIALLSRTVQNASAQANEKKIAAELVIGATSPQTCAASVYVNVHVDGATISTERHETRTLHPIPPILVTLIACYAAGALLNRALSGAMPFEPPDPFAFRFDELGIPLSALSQPIELGRAYLAGAGAIGNGFLWAARHLDIRGQLDLVDDDAVSSGNLNRQIWFQPGDIGTPKVETLATRAQPYFQKLELRPRLCRLQDIPEKSAGPWLGRLIVAVDSRRARREIQNEFPGEVFDASTTDIREIVVHHHHASTSNACLSCIYEPDDQELSREQHVADHLGVSINDVRSERITKEVAIGIVARFPRLQATALVGMAYDSLFKRLCGEGQLRTLAGRTVIAPFGFVSVLAGTLLAIELVRRVTGTGALDFNYWRVSPWYPPIGRRRTMRPRQHDCAFCGNPLFQEINARLWPS